MLRLALVLSLLSLVVMVLVDRWMGARAEFLNAWSVVERLLGRHPLAGRSRVAQRFGAAGEALAVILANALVGAVLCAALQLGKWLLR
ncbi:MAG: hypothetical protein AB7Q69_03765 [Gemmatimonadales bacterium]